MGIVPAGTELSERMWFLPDPIVLALVPRAVLGKKMELYAGMVENLDFHVGRLVDHLKQIAQAHRRRKGRRRPAVSRGAPGRAVRAEILNRLPAGILGAPWWRAL